jgi:hypothetical protein
MKSVAADMYRTMCRRMHVDHHGSFGARRAARTQYSGYTGQGLSVSHMLPYQHEQLTFPRVIRGFPCDLGLFERSPLVVLLVTTTCYCSPSAMFASGFCLIALQTLCFASDASYVDMLTQNFIEKAKYYACFANNNIRMIGSLPFRLFDCFLLVTPLVSDAFAAFLLANIGVDTVFFAALVLI